MDKKKKIILAVALVLALCLGGFCFFSSTYVVVNGEVYERAATEVVMAGQELPDVEALQKIENLSVLDIRNISVTAQEYEQLQQQLGQCRILWNVPFQGGHQDCEITELTVSALTQEDVARLKYFSKLQTLDASGSTDYDVLMQLRADRSDLNVIYTVDIGGALLRENTAECAVTNDNIRNLMAMLQYLPELNVVNADGCTDYEALMELKQAYPELTVNYTVPISGVDCPGDATELTFENADVEQIGNLLKYLPNVTDVIFIGEVPENEVMYQLKCQYPDVVMHWDFELFGVQTSSTAKELILNDIAMKSTDPVEEALKYFYNLERVEMCHCGIPSADMDALWKRHPETRFVWAVFVGSAYIRTDITALSPFMLRHSMGNPMYNYHIQELKYCVDLICLDMGHMRFSDISFLEYMPKLQYLIIADTWPTDFTPLASLSELVYLEIFMCMIKDLSPLLELKNLECLNLGWTRCNNPELLKEMTWLTHLWANNIGITDEQVQELKDALPNTVVYVSPNKTHGSTSGGWRQIDRYYEMRDLLGLEYMK